MWSPADSRASYVLFAFWISIASEVAMALALSPFTLTGHDARWAFALTAAGTLVVTVGLSELKARHPGVDDSALLEMPVSQVLRADSDGRSLPVASAVQRRAIVGCGALWVGVLVVYMDKRAQSVGALAFVVVPPAIILWNCRPPKDAVE